MYWQAWPHQPWCFPSVLTCALLGYRRTKGLETIEIPLPFFPSASSLPPLFPVVSGIPYSHKVPEEHMAGAASWGSAGVWDLRKCTRVERKRVWKPFSIPGGDPTHFSTPQALLQGRTLPGQRPILVLQHCDAF